MKGFFKFEGQPGWEPYTGRGMGGGLMPRQQALQPQGQMMQPEPMPQPSMMPQQAPQQAQPPAQGPQLPSLSDAKDAYDQIKDGLAGPTYQEPPHVSNPAPNYTGADPYDPAHYQGTLTDAELPNNNPVTDPSNYQGTLTGTADTSNPVFNPDSYQGTLYDPSNPLGLTEAEWVTQQGLMNSGSLLQEGMGLASNAGLAGGLSDMGGVADEIVGQGGGMMGNAAGAVGDAVPYIAAAKGIYDLSQNWGDPDAMASTASTTIATIWPNPVTIGFAAAVGLTQFLTSKGRNYDYLHPYVTGAFQDKNGAEVYDLNFNTDIDNANEEFYDGRTGDQTPFNSAKDGYHRVAAYNKNDGNYYWVRDSAEYIGVESYEDYIKSQGYETYDYDISSNNESGSETVTDYSPGQSIPDRAAYNQRVADIFQKDIYDNGFDFAREGVIQGEHGDFKDKGDTTFMGGTGSANQLVRTSELNAYRDAGEWGDQSRYADYSDPGLDSVARLDYSQVRNPDYWDSQEYDDDMSGGA